MNSLKVAIASVVVGFSLCAHAADSHSTAGAGKSDLLNTFTCEKFSGSLSELKLKLIETCNLEKNFTSSMTRTVAGDEIYLLCCHKAK